MVSVAHTQAGPMRRPHRLHAGLRSTGVVTCAHGRHGSPRTGVLGAPTEGRFRNSCALSEPPADGRRGRAPHSPS
eukprot:2081606-Prymnesium_polylepis.1